MYISRFVFYYLFEIIFLTSVDCAKYASSRPPSRSATTQNEGKRTSKGSKEPQTSTELVTTRKPETTSRMVTESDNLFARHLVYPESVTTSGEFRELVRTKQFIDKTTFLQYILTQDTIYITGPPRFGKTALLTMTQTFLAGKFDSNGNKVPGMDEVRKIFSHPERFDGDKTPLKVYENTTFFNQFFQSFIVMFINFQPLSEVVDYSSYGREMCNIYHRTLNDLNLLASEIPSVPRCETLANILAAHSNTAKFVDDCVDNFENRKMWLYDLSQSLHVCFKRKVLVLIDEFDALLQAILTEEIPPSDVKRIIRYTTGACTRLAKDNNAVHSTVAMGVLNLGGMASTQINNIVHQDFFFDETVGHYFGFQKHDVSVLLQRYGLRGREEQVARSFNGYQVYGRDDEIYNAGSILLFCKTGGNIGKGHSWLKMAKWHKVFNPLFSDVEFGKRVCDSLRGNVSIDIVHNVLGYEPVLDLLKKIDRSSTVPKRNYGLKPTEQDILFQYFLQCGYYRLTKDGKQRWIERNSGFTEFKPTTRMVIEPTNEETSHALWRALLESDYFKFKYNVTPYEFGQFYEALIGIKSDDAAEYTTLVESVYDMVKGQDIRKEIDLQVVIYAAIKKYQMDEKIRAHEMELKLKNGHVIDFSVLPGERPIALVVEIEKTDSAYLGIRQIIEDDHFTVLKQASFAKYTIERVALIGLRCTPVGKKKEGEKREIQCSLCYLFSHRIEGFDERDLKKVECVAYPDKEGKTVKRLHRIRDNDKWVKSKAPQR